MCRTMEKMRGKGKGTSEESGRGSGSDGERGDTRDGQENAAAAAAAGGAGRGRVEEEILLNSVVKRVNPGFPPACAGEEHGKQQAWSAWPVFKPDFVAPRAVRL